MGGREAPRGGAGIEIGRRTESRDARCEAPRGGAGIEMRIYHWAYMSASEAPRGGAGIEMCVESLAKKAFGSPSWRGWY